MITLDFSISKHKNLRLVDSLTIYRFFFKVFMFHTQSLI